MKGRGRCLAIALMGMTLAQPAWADAPQDLRLLAERGNTVAQTLLGLDELTGQDMPKNEAQGCSGCAAPPARTTSRRNIISAWPMIAARA
ncbi:hypothetical protein GT370_19595 [Acidocella sp. MX-AZ03]|uniref:hypothetical protein n=1 Tax=Acidocella sp. MX-AZ03 TaxID=2697363 RepID=UPI0022DD7757|nr:hypothetical protein [Acidocella sp. MX-AZ03]WBO59220.1 hypothetical protein GT370_19595 [Acidocella sp. MX-AZ03]